MALLSPQQIQITGTEVTYSPASGGGDTVRPGERTFLHVKNDDVADKTVTIVVPGTKFGQALPDVQVVVTAGEERFIGPLSRELADTDGFIDITYSATTSVTIAAVII